MRAAATTWPTPPVDRLVAIRIEPCVCGATIAVQIDHDREDPHTSIERALMEHNATVGHAAWRAAREAR